MSEHLHCCRDRTGREIKEGDILKVFHFIGARRKRHFMYKQAMKYVTINNRDVYLKISHLNRVDGEPWEIGKNYYLESATGWPLKLYEIIQSADRGFETRPKVIPDAKA